MNAPEDVGRDQPKAARRLLREFQPRKTTWVGLLSSPTSYLVLVALSATLAAKLVAASQLQNGPGWPFALGAVLADIGVYGLIGALFAAVESRGRGAWVATMPVAGVITLFALANALFLVSAGEQGSWGAVKDFFRRFEDVEMVLSEEAGDPARLVPLFAFLLAVVFIPLAARSLFVRLKGSERPPTMARRRCGALTSVGAAGAVMTALLPAPQSVEGRGLSRNAAVVTARGMVFRGLERGDFSGFPSDSLVDTDVLAATEGVARPNVVLVVLESTRWDHTSLAGDQSKAQTPHLAKLAARGTEFARTRAVLPHTTKSLFTALCGRLPTLQRGVIEVDGRHEVDCLADVFKRAGYRTAFFQSAFGTFEDRPRLVDQFGYDDFRAWEDLRGERLGYLASDDASLAPAFKDYVKGGEGPFFVTLLTSATHHPYRIPKTAQGPKGAPPLDALEAPERYAALVGASDRMVGRVVRSLKRTGHLDDTIVIVFGDHGEGFGDHGVRQHDNNYYEEGLRVPWVMAGPGVPEGERVDANASLLDVVPTLLGRMGWPQSAELGGVDLLDDVPGDERALLFACYASRRCRGYVSGTRKVVEIPESGERFAFDLSSDPDERAPLVPSAGELQQLDLVRTRVLAQRTPAWPIQASQLVRFGLWRCFLGDVCRHPAAHKTKRRVEAHAYGKSP